MYHFKYCGFFVLFFCKCKHAAICNRTFMIDAAKETSPDPPTIPVIRWLNAINPDVFTEQAIRYTKWSHLTIYHPSYSRHTDNIHVHSQIHIHTLVCQAITIPSILLLCREPYVIVFGVTAAYCMCGYITCHSSFKLQLLW